MFREVARTKQAMTPEECAHLLTEQVRGVLSVRGDDGYPYGMPMDYLYDAASGRLYFHCGKSGHRTDALRRCDKVSFCVTDSGTRPTGEWYLEFRSVIVFGRVQFVEDTAELIELCRRLSYRFTDDTIYIEREIANFTASAACFALVPEHITGKRVKES